MNIIIKSKLCLTARQLLCYIIIWFGHCQMVYFYNEKLQGKGQA